MSHNILVTYGSKHGSTGEIAEAIAKTLRDAGHTVSVTPVDEVKALGDYDAYVIGSAVYVGGWMREAAQFLTEHADALARKHVWLFSSGPTGEGDPVETLDGWTFPEKLKPVADQIQPHGIVLFHGALESGKLGFVERLMVRGVKAPMGDFRDWESIQQWASGIDETLRET